jgi:hypothetical protein
MPVPWLTVLQNVPWTEVIRNAPKVADGARKLWQAVGKKPQVDTQAPLAVDATADAVALQARVGTLEAAIADLHAQMVASSELIKALADQNAQLIARIESNRQRWRWTAGALAAIGVVAAVALVLVFLWRQPHV